MTKYPQLPPKRRKFSKQHLANLRAAHAKRRKANKIVTGLREAITDYKPDDWKASFVEANECKIDHNERKTGLIDRMTQAIDKIKEQIERLETL